MDGLESPAVPMAIPTVPQPKYPTLTNEEKLAVREAQFVRTNTIEQANAAIQAADRNLGTILEALGKKYNLNPKLTQINSVTLEFVDAP
jgi:hypothetical protein